MSSAAGAAESFAVVSCRERWLEFLALDHATLCPIEDVTGSDGALVVKRRGMSGRPLGDGRIPRPWRAPLLLQLSAAAAFFASLGFPLEAGDLDDAVWDAPGGLPRFWVRRTPRAVSVASRTPPNIVIAEGLRRLCGPAGSRISPGAARELHAALSEATAGLRRGEHWVASVLRAFPELGDAALAPVRERCLGLGSLDVRDAFARGLAAKARAILEGKAPRLFQPGPSALTPGGALRLNPPAPTLSAAVRALRELAAARDGRRVVWIAVEPETWDALSRRAFEAARRATGGDVEIVVVPGECPSPDSPAEWRRAIWAPCGSLGASVRFYEWLDATAERGPRAVCLVRRVLGSPAWPAYVTDPTGDAPLPAPIERTASEGIRRAAPTRGGADTGRRIEELLEENRPAEALREAERWIFRFPERPPESWFALSARLAAACDTPRPFWLEAIEAEREVAGGRTLDGRARHERIARAVDAAPDERRRAGLRAAELTAALGQASDAARRAAEWRRAYPAAPHSEAVRALRLGAIGLSREGRIDCAVGLLDEADALSVSLPAAERIENALVRAAGFALAGRFDEEAAIYEGIRALALGSGEEALAARFLAQEARGLLDRREYARAIVRLEEALAASRSDPGESAALQLDLAAARYHAGDEPGSESALGQAIAAAEAAGREDLAWVARGNRVELLVNRLAWSDAEAEIAALLASAAAGKDATRRLVALHHRSRLALRRGFLEVAARDNAQARRLAEQVGDRLEIGELLLEDGDRRLLEGDRAGARDAWEQAAAKPSDRCARESVARSRLTELGWAEGGGPPAEARRALEALLEREPYSGAERVARWLRLFGPSVVPAEVAQRAARRLREAGGGELAARVFGAGAPPPAHEDLRRVRDAVLAALSGRNAGLDGSLARLGLTGLAVRDAAGATLVSLGEGVPAEETDWRRLEGGALSAAFRPAAAPEVAASLGLLLETILLRERPDETPAELSPGWKRHGIVTGDVSMEEPFRRLNRFAPQGVTVLVLGESGAGKEAVARAIHGLSPRAAWPFVPVNVAAIPAGVLESELFGHARGAFSGADRDRRGLLEEASGGTIFFDEIGDLALPLQAKLLRALQERELRRVGENRSRAIDVRVVSATSRDLARDVEAGRFREDLFYRLHVAVIRLPPLRERGRDAVLLARHFLDRYAREYGRGALRLAPESAAAIGAWGWPGNVRELQNAMAQAAALSDSGGLVTPDLLPEAVRPVRVSPKRGPARGDYRARVDAHRRGLIADALDRAGGNRSRAARDLGMSRQALLYLIRELKVEGGPSKQ